VSYHGPSDTSQRGPRVSTPCERDLGIIDVWPKKMPTTLAKVGMKTVSEFFGIPKTDFKIFSIRFVGNGIFRKQNRFSEFSIGISIVISVVFYRPFPSVTGFCWKLPDLCLEIFQNCVSEFFGIFQHVIFRIACTSLDKDYLFLYFLDALRFFCDICVGRQLRLTIWSFPHTRF
jgi:hypothetical protein